MREKLIELEQDRGLASNGRYTGVLQDAGGFLKQWLSIHSVHCFSRHIDIHSIEMKLSELGFWVYYTE